MTALNFFPFPIHSTQRLQLRQLQATDGQALFAIRSNPENTKHLSRPLDKTIADSQAFIQKINNGIQEGEWIYWGLVLKSTDQLIGTICIWGISIATENAEIGYELHPEFQGQGFMQEAIEFVLDYGFTQMRLKKIEAYLSIHNQKSIRVLERNGFQFLQKAGDEEKFEVEGKMDMLIYFKKR